RRHGAARMSEQHHVAPRLETIQTLVEGCSAHGVVHDVDTAARQPLHFGFEILLRVKDDFIRARLSSKLGLRLVADGGINGGAQLLRDLRQQEADSAGPGVYKSP